MPAGTSIVFASYGVTAEVVVDDAASLAEVTARLPPGWQAGDASDVQARFALTARGDVVVDGEPVPGDDGLTALDRLEAVVRTGVALGAQDYVFIHAGVAAVGGRAIVAPGSSYAGKSTLVAALVAAGADYYSDEFAVLDNEGRVHPYPRPLSLRLDWTTRQEPFTVDALGGVAAQTPADVAVVAAVRYTPGASGRPVTGTAADGALALLSHALPVRARPGQALAAVRRATEGATVIEGARGEAHEAADALLAMLATP